MKLCIIDTEITYNRLINYKKSIIRLYIIDNETIYYQNKNIYNR